MKLTESILELLEDAKKPVSGEEMAAQLGLSRNSVWKSVQKLRKEGYEIEAGTNRGYFLVSEGNVLSAANIRRRLVGKANCVAIDVQQSVTSTNTVLKGLAEKGGAEGMVIIAEQQTAGKGRLGRTFFSPQGMGLYMSILLRPKFPPQDSLFITTAAAVAVAGAVEALTGRKAKIKWVNDVYVDGRKVCGILTEASIDFENQGLAYAVLGIGVNIREPEGGFTGDLKDIAGSLYKEDPPPGARTILTAEILNRFFAFYENLTDRAFMDEYKKRSLLTGMKIHFAVGDRVSEGVVQGIDDDARLLVKLDSGKTAAFAAGEVTINKDFLDQLEAERTTAPVAGPSK